MRTFKYDFGAMLGAAGVAAIALSTLTPQAAIAGTLSNGWNYAIDAPNDSLSRDPSAPGGIKLGDTNYEMYWMAVKEDWETDSLVFAINANMGLEGTPSGADDGRTQFGDLFLNFYRGNQNDAINTGNLYAIRFVPDNNSGAPTLGVYSSVNTAPVSIENDGFYLQGYYGTVASREGTYGAVNRNNMFGDFSQDRFSDYVAYESRPPGLFQPIGNVIQAGTGNLIGSVTSLTEQELLAAGLDPSVAPISGSRTIGFKVARSLFPKGNFIAHLLVECINDALALLGQLTPPPPPPPSPDDICIFFDEAQNNPFLPSYTDREWSVFDNVASDRWYDPAAMFGFDIEAQGLTQFMGIRGLPCGIGVNRFAIRVNGKRLGRGFFKPGESVDFSDFGYFNGVNKFEVLFVDPDDPERLRPFPINLGFNTSTGSFRMKPINEPPHPPIVVPESDMIPGLAILGIIGFSMMRSRKTNG